MNDIYVIKIERFEVVPDEEMDTKLDCLDSYTLHNGYQKLDTAWDYVGHIIEDHYNEHGRYFYEVDKIRIDNYDNWVSITYHTIPLPYETDLENFKSSKFIKFIRIETMSIV